MAQKLRLLEVFARMVAVHPDISVAELLTRFTADAEEEDLPVIYEHWWELMDIGNMQTPELSSGEPKRE